MHRNDAALLQFCTLAPSDKLSGYRAESQSAWVGKGPLESFGPNSQLKQDQAELAVQDHIQPTFGNLQWGRLHSLQKLLSFSERHRNNKLELQFWHKTPSISGRGTYFVVLGMAICNILITIIHSRSGRSVTLNIQIKAVFPILVCLELM